MTLRRMLAVLTVLVLALAPAACASPGPGDRMSGKIVAAQTPASDPKGPQIAAPGELSGLAEVRAYDSNGKVGTQMVFQTITFGQFNQLGEVVSQAFDTSAASIKMRVQRTGGTVILSGTADLSSLAPNAAVIVVSLQFPGPVTATNGQQESNDLVTWTLNSGTSAALTAEADYADPSIASFTRWAWITVLVSFLTAGIVGALAYLRRDRSPKPGQENAEPESLVELPQWLRQKLGR
ncbi:LppM family (lipo)protein [Tsukamurella serpentis]